MSKYFETLGRLKEEAWAETPIPSRTVQTPESDPSSSDSREQILGTTPGPKLQDDRFLQAMSGCLDSVRALTHSSTTPAAVFAGVSSSAPVDLMMEGIPILAQKKGIEILVGELVISEGTRMLRRLPSTVGTRHTGLNYSSRNFSTLKQCDLSSGWSEASKWIARVSASSDLVILKAPPILDVVDSALLGKIAGGLILVVELHKTANSDLKAAVKRITSSGCHILGVVTVGVRSRVPNWLQNLLQNSQEPKAASTRMVAQ